MQKQITYKKVIIGIVVAVGAYWLWSPGQSPQGDMKPGAGNAVPVTVLRLQKKLLNLQEELPGRTTAYQVAEIRPQVSGIITERLFQEGSEVKEGQQLYQIDPSTYQVAYNSAKADIAKAEANVMSLKAKANRYAELVKTEAVSKQEYDDTTAQLAQANADVGIAKAKLEVAQINLAYTKVYAPISGRIGKSEVTKGALVTASQDAAIARITQLDPIYVDLTLSSTQLALIRPALQGKKEIPVTLSLEKNAAPYAYEGKLQFTDVTVEPGTGSVMLRTIFPNPKRELLPGMFVSAQVQLEETEALLVPQRAAIRNPDGTLSVWLVDNDSKVNPKAITVDKTIGDKWLVTDGVSEGDIIVLEGFQKLAPGAAVTATPAEGVKEKTADKPAAKEVH